jgi:uncharacterized protein
MDSQKETLALLDYRRRVAEIYAGVRSPAASAENRWQEWRKHRNRLFADHPLSPLAAHQKPTFGSLSYFPYNPALRFVLALDRATEESIEEIELADDGPIKMRSAGTIHFEIGDAQQTLTVFRILGYGGGLFLPFRDATNGAKSRTSPQETADEFYSYGGGRYLLDTIKSADLGSENGRLIIDFNFAYNPSCAYNPRWHCPLAPRENHLNVPIRAGELDPLFGVASMV